MENKNCLLKGLRPRSIAMLKGLRVSRWGRTVNARRQCRLERGEISRKKSHELKKFVDNNPLPGGGPAEKRGEEMRRLLFVQAGGGGEYLGKRRKSIKKRVVCLLGSP